MKRPLIITIGIVIILTVLGLWVYLMLFGNPDNGREVFTNFGFDVSPQPVTTVDQPVGDGTNYLVDTNNAKLQQLTTKPVAGFVGTMTASTSVVRYVEQGTGHIYEINTDSGEETMISRTTIPRVESAHFSPDGSTVAITSITGYNKDTLFGSIDFNENKFQSSNLPPNSDNIYVTNQNDVRYTYPQDDQLVGYEQTVSGDVKELFRVPFKSIQVLWSETDTWFYNRPAKNLLGYLYQVDGRDFISTPLTGFGLVAKNFEKYLGYSQYKDGGLESNFYDSTNAKTYPSPIAVIPEKCAPLNFGNDIVCAAPLTKDINIDDWYKGVAVSEDYLWRMNVTGGESVLLENFVEIAGRPIDVSNLAADSTESYLLFTNKIDGTLWRYAI